MSGRLVLLRHGQSYGNVERRLDTLPPGTALTPLGRDQARAFARSGCRRPALLAHSVAIRAYQTAAVVAAELDMVAHEVAGIHEVQVGELENRNDDEAVAEFNATYSRWHRGELDVPLPGGETANDVLDRYLPVLADLRMRYLDDGDWDGDIVVVSHSAAIRLAAAVLGGGRQLCVGQPLGKRRVGGAGPDNRWAMELCAVGPPEAAVLSGPR